MKVVAQGLSRDAKGRQRFHREARAIAALRHSNIVEIYDYSGAESEHLYLVMEKLEGDDLFNIMNSKGMMPEPAAAAVGHELCLALQVAHEAGVIHRDLKPENVFMDGQGRVVLTDFGVVKAIREDSAVDGWQSETDVIGTPGFMAPELMMNRALGPRTDIFALGALLYNIATGELPYEGDSPVEMFRNVVSGDFRDARQYNPGLSREFVDLLTECLQAKPKKRFRSVEIVRERLKAVLEHNGVSDLRDDFCAMTRATPRRTRAGPPALGVVPDLAPESRHQGPRRADRHGVARAPARGRPRQRRGPRHQRRHHAGRQVGARHRAARPRAREGGRLAVLHRRRPCRARRAVRRLSGLPQPRPLGDDHHTDTTKPNDDHDNGRAPDQPSVGKNLPPDKSGDGSLEILILNGRGQLYVDGKRYGKVHTRP